MLKGSWKTTAYGIVLALGILCTQATAILDSDPNTQVDPKAIVGALVAIGGAIGLGASARDNNKTSEQVGAGAPK